MIKVRFDLEPLPKGRPRVARGRVYTPAATRIFEHNVATIAKHYARINKLEPLTGPLEVIVMFNLKKPKSVRRDVPGVKPDLDNLVKGLFDGVNGILWHDDAQVVMLACSKSYAPAEGFIDLLIKPV